MTTLSELQTAFYEMYSLIAQRDGWILTVFESDNDPRVHSAEWVRDGDVVYMSDPLYSMYCAEIGMKNENMRR